MKTKKLSGKHGRKGERRRRTARPRDEAPAPAQATPAPYPDFQRDYASTLWL